MSTENQEEQSVAPPVEVVPKGVLDEVMSTFKASLADVTQAVAATKPTPGMSGPSPEERAEKARQDHMKALSAYQEKCAEGKYDEAMAEFLQFLGKQQSEAASQQQQDPTESRGYKGLVKQARILAKGQHQAMFAKYEDEIVAEIEAMPPDARYDPDAWAEAVGNVRMRHQDELLDEAVNERIERMRQEGTFGPPTSAPRGGLSKEDRALNLDEEELGVAKSLGLTPKQYAENKKFIETSANRDGTVDVLPLPDTPDGRVPAGRF